MATINNKKTMEYYLNLPWTFTIEQEIDKNNGKLYIVRVHELPGVVTDAPTIEEALKSIKEAMLLAFEMYQEAGEEIPEPLNQKQCKGNIAYRTTSERHYLIAREAKKRNLSLSQVLDTFVDNCLKMISRA